MQFDWWTFALQAINILILIWVLSHFLFRPIANIIEQRRNETQEALKSAEEARKTAEGARAAAEAEKQKNASERFKILDAARADAQSQKEQIIAKAQDEAKEIVAAARTAAEKTSEDAEALKLRRAAELAVSMTGRLLANLPEDGRVAGYDRRLADLLGGLGEREAQSLRRDADELTLVVPRALDEGELAAIRKTLSSALPDVDAIAVEVDESRLAGLELRGPHAVVHNSLGADLQQMAEALSGETQD